MADRIIRGTAGNGQIRFFGVNCLETAIKAQEIHELSITTSVLTGRLLAAALMMGLDQKSADEKLTIKLAGSGEVKTVIVTSDNQGRVKCYLSNPKVELPLSENGTINVSGALGEGTLTVIKDMGSGHPYQGTIELQNGEIATDLSYYFSQSEQIPTAMGLGVLIEPEGEIRQAGGFLVQLMPDAENSVIDILERNLRELPNLTDLLDMGYKIEEILEKLILMGLDIKILLTQPAKYYCDCSREKFLHGVKLLDKVELEESIAKSEDVVVQCHFCNKEYHYESEELKQILVAKD
ncbi:MAG: Hsp33 family molecular chaperone HslO [Candidatus Stygibacter australis]|nr:Hsp33 family molecular chaperone HslO [Candidatus Stygibacter australis]MDP8323086.1 Hsp33 family molecular chaperone HslO [Candidatus Stygibacter australis]